MAISSMRPDDSRAVLDAPKLNPKTRMPQTGIWNRKRAISPFIFLFASTVHALPRDRAQPSGGVNACAPSRPGPQREPGSNAFLGRYPRYPQAFLPDYHAPIRARGYNAPVAWRSSMGELVFLCPRTAREIETGINTDRGSIARTRRRTIYLDCPHCREPHSFKVGQGWIDNYARSVPPLAETA
jgi:hypothetical protein